MQAEPMVEKLKVESPTAAIIEMPNAERFPKLS
jgi:hypothetical protein